MSAHERSLVGSVIERTAVGKPSDHSSRFTKAPGAGFPTAQHRFKSAFARAREEANSRGDGIGGANGTDVPLVVSAKSHAQQLVAPTASIVDSKPIPTDNDALRRQIHEENTRKIALMSEEEIDEEKRAILEQLGDGAGELLRRVQEARLRKEAAAQEGHQKNGGVIQDDNALKTTEHEQNNITRTPSIASPSPRRVSQGLAAKPGVLRVKSLENIGQSVPLSLPTTSSTRPSSRTGRKLRFAEVTPEDVHVYESAPRSPKRTVLALPPPPETTDDSIVSLGTFKENSIPFKRSRPPDSPTENQSMHVEKDEEEPEEGTPEYIRRRYFPNVSTRDPSLAWMDISSEEATDLSAPRFDLHGTPIPPSLSASLPSHLGLHHHAEGNHAGYTINDIFLLSRSSVPAQRALMLGILARIAHRLGQQVRQPDCADRILAFAGQEGELRKRILAVGLGCVDQIGSLGARAAEVILECLVEWDGNMNETEGIELDPASDVISLLQLHHFLPQITDVLSHAALPPESLAQLLTVVHWLARQSNKVADMITNTPRLIQTILTTFLLTPIPSREDSRPPNPVALQLLITLASASRSNALALLDPADALLRFVTIPPPSSPYPFTLASMLVTCTLQFYTTLTSYGLYSHIAATASHVFTTLSSYILSLSSASTNPANTLESTQLRVAWASLVEAWTVSATDPHATSPPHDILWSQIYACGWATDMRKLRKSLRDERSDWAAYAVMWDVEAAWLEGSRINGIKGGEAERDEALRILGSTFATTDGTEFRIVWRALGEVQRDLAQDGPTTIQGGRHVLESLATAGNVLASALRLFLACLPQNDEILTTPPFALPLSELSALSAALVKHPVWFFPSALNSSHLQMYLRPLTRFIAYFHRVSRYIPGTTPQLWFAQALVFLSRLIPGDESHALAMLGAFSLVGPQFIGVDPAELPQNIYTDVLRPFFEYTIRPEGEAYVAPLRPSPESILRSSTLRLPSPHSPETGSDDTLAPTLARSFAAGLPLSRDLLFTPLTHLLRSGTSPVFYGSSLPGNWMANEVDVVRATLLLVFAARKVLVTHGLEEFAHGAAEVVFACMRVCMLEHGVGGAEAEVFRDAGVERLMVWLLRPYTAGKSPVAGECAATTSTTPPYRANVRTLEDASAPYLGTTPFYQFYTDLVALYGAVSFGHKLFAALVATPLAMTYAVDYRRALWCGGDGAIASSSSSSDTGSGRGHPNGGGGGLGDVVRSVRIPIEDVICTGAGGEASCATGPREYLYPIERDIGVLGAYAAALVTHDGGRAEGFLRLVAVHHVACTLWGHSDEVSKEKESGDENAKQVGAEEVEEMEEMRARLLRVVLAHGDADVVRDVVLYRQRLRGAFAWPPVCYRGGENESGTGDIRWREGRLAFVRRSMDNEAIEQVGKLLMPTAVTT